MFSCLSVAYKVHLCTYLLYVYLPMYASSLFIDILPLCVYICVICLNHVTQLSLTNKFINCRLQFDLRIDGLENVTIPASFTDQVRLGYLDVAIAKKFAKLTCHLVL